MPSNHYTHVCIPCRNVIGWGLCPECGGERVTVARWSAPKKNNDRAWKRIEKGEWLWDRRRVRRAERQPWTWFSPPTHKKGQRKTFQRGVRRANGANVDLGG